MKTFVTFFLLAVAAVLLLGSMREGFRSEFLDESGYKKTLDSKFSSYSQVTNHFNKVPDHQPPSGTVTTHRVNQFFGRRDSD